MKTPCNSMAMNLKENNKCLKIQKNASARRDTALWQRMALELASRYEPETAEKMAQGILTPSSAARGGALASDGHVTDANTGTEDAKHMIRARERTRSVSQPD